MKKKWTALKRRWRKLHRIDRQSYRLIGAFTLLYLPLSFWSLAFLLNLIRVVSLGILYSIHIYIRREWQYVYWLEGRSHQIKSDMIKYRRVVWENAEMKFKYDRLNTDYKKLESDYNQLKTKDKKWKQTSNRK